MFWYVGPWIWDATLAGGCWRSPAGCSGLDLRPLPLQSQRGGTPGMGLFFGSVARPQLENRSDYRLLGSGSWHDIRPTGVDRDAIPRRAGYTPKGDDLVGVVYDLLTDGADPDGLDGPKPLMPTTAGLVELICGQRHAERFKFGRSGHTAKVRQLLRKEFAGLFADAKSGRLKDAEHHRRVLDFWCEKYGVEDWKEFVPLALQVEVPGRLKHETTQTDDFNRADGEIGASWTEHSGDTDIVSNQAKTMSAGENTTYYASDLSSADHYSQLSMVASLDFCGPTCRNAAAETFYCTLKQTASSSVQMYKRVAGSFTSLGSASNSITFPKTYKIEANGSTIKAYYEGTEQVSATDTAITGNLRAGFRGFAANNIFDDWQAADLGGGGGGIIYTQLERGLRGYARGVYEGRP